MSRMRIMSGLYAAAAVGLAACGGGTTSTGDPLTQAEAEELAAALAEGGFVGFGAAPSAPRAPGAEAATITVALNDTYACDDGGGTGTVQISGSVTVNINETTGVGNFTFNYTMTPNGCQLTTTGGKVFTLDGDPNIKVDGDFDWSDTSAHGTLHYKGDFAWASSDNRSGACGVDLTSNYDFTFSGTGTSTATATVSGTICGVSVNRTVNYTA